MVTSPPPGLRVDGSCDVEDTRPAIAKYDQLSITISTSSCQCSTVRQAEVGTLLEGKGFGAENLRRLCPEQNGSALWGGKGERCVRDQEVHGG